jgi:hypothetical protein
LPLASFSTCRSHYPGGPRRVRVSVTSPSRGGLPLSAGRSASTTILSGPAQDSLALRPADLLEGLSPPLSRGFAAANCFAASLGSYGVEPTTSPAELSSAGHQRLRGARRVEEAARWLQGSGIAVRRQLSPRCRCLTPSHGFVSAPRSSNRTCGSPASGSPTGFHAKAHAGARRRSPPICWTPSSL